MGVCQQVGGDRKEESTQKDGKIDARGERQGSEGKRREAKVKKWTQEAVRNIFF